MIYDPRWKRLGWPKDYDAEVWIPLKKLKQCGTKEAIQKAFRLVYHYCFTDLWFFAYFVLGIAQKYPTHMGNPFHIELCGVLNTIDPKHWTQDWAFFLPRGHLKSQLVTVAKSIQLILRYPGIRIAIASGKEDEAKGQLRKIKETFERNTFLRTWFPHVVPQDPKIEGLQWMEKAIRVKQPEGTVFQETEPTVSAYSLQGLDTGPHYDFVIFDDGVDIENSKSPTLIENTNKAFRELLLHLEPTCPRIFVGTFYDYADAHCQTYKTWLDERRREQPHIINVYIRKLKYEEDEPWSRPEGTNVGDYIFHTKWNDLAVERFRHKMGLSPKQFASQMLMSPIAPGETKFDEDWLQYYELLSHERGTNKFKFRIFGKSAVGGRIEPKEIETELFLCMTADYAASERSSADYTVITVTGVAPGDDWFVLDYARGHFTGLEAEDEIVKLWRKYPNIRELGLETENIGKHATPYIEKRLREENIKMAVNPLGQPRAEKYGRIEKELGWRGKARKIFISEGMAEFGDEWVRFGTAGGTVDILDTVSNVEKIRQIPQIPINETEHQRKVRELIAYYKGELPGQVQPAEESPLEYGYDTIEEELLFA